MYDGKLSKFKDKHIKTKSLEIRFNKKVRFQQVKNFGKVLEYNENGYYAKLEVPIQKHTKIASQILRELPINDLDINELSLTEIIRKVF